MKQAVQQDRLPDEVPMPPEVFMALLPPWVKFVWLAVRAHQGIGDSCTASYAEIGKMCITENGTPTKRQQVYRGVKMLMEAGLMYRKNDVSLVCLPETKIRKPTVDAVNCQFTDRPKHPQKGTSVNQQLTIVKRANTAQKSTSANHEFTESDSGKGGTIGGDSEKVISNPERIDKGESEGGRKTKVSRIDSLTLDERLKKYAAKKAPLVDSALELEKFKNYCAAKGRRYKDYRRAFQNWLLQAQQWAEERRPKPAKLRLDLTQPVSSDEMLAATDQLGLCQDDFYGKGQNWKGENLFMLKPEKRREIGI